MSFDKHSCAVHHQYIKHCITPKFLHVLCSQTALPTPSPWQLLTCLLSLQFCLFQNVYQYNKIVCSLLSLAFLIQYDVDKSHLCCVYHILFWPWFRIISVIFLPRRNLMGLKAPILTSKRDQVPGGLCLLHVWVSCCEGRIVITFRNTALISEYPIIWGKNFSHWP